MVLDKKTSLNGWKDSYPVELDTRKDEKNKILDDVQKNSAMSKNPVEGEPQINTLSSNYMEITSRHDFRGYVLFHVKQKLTSRGAKGR